jgi:hypothetical protein
MEGTTIKAQEGFIEAQELDLSPLERRLDDMSDRLEKVAAKIEAPKAGPAPKGPTPLEWFTAEVQALRGNFQKREAVAESWAGFQTRALQDVEGTLPTGGAITDASGLVVEEYIGAQLVNVLDASRPLFASMGRFPMPRSGYARIPIVTQHTLVGPRTAGQKSPANSRKLIVQQASFEAEWYDGAVDVALELVAMAEPPIVQMVWDDLLAQYAIATEAGLLAVIEDGQGFTFTGTTLPTTDYPAFAAAVATQARVVRKNSGAPATRLAVTEADWPKLIAFVDANDRRIGSTRGPSNADFSADFTAESFELPGGITVFPGGDGLTKAVLYNTESLKVADGGPERVQALNVELMGQDLGVLGRVMIVPRIPAGVVVFGTAPTS